MYAFLLFSFLLASQVQPGTPKAAPPGTERIADNLFLDKQLISHLSYQECLHYLKRHDPSRYPEMVPADTTVSFNGQIMWNNPAFHDYPIAGLSEEQMLAYCAWRSMVVNRPRFDPEARQCNEKLWKKVDKADPGKSLEVVYSLPDAGVLTQRTMRKEMYQLDEMSRQGRVERERSAGISHPEYVVFRCVASYRPRQ
ncbi:MAG: hypothetical protein KF852_07570 [Saprospiraceae bacterium]|nr:hypothetical protein [Saprospiraceae bacterium]